MRKPAIVLVIAMSLAFEPSCALCSHGLQSHGLENGVGDTA